jgi:hypothetical protein
MKRKLFSICESKLVKNLTKIVFGSDLQLVMRWKWLNDDVIFLIKYYIKFN